MIKPGYTLLLFSYLFLNISYAQVCTNCTISLPVIPQDTIFIDNLPNGYLSSNYEEQVSFRFSHETTPLVQFGFPAGLSISYWKITGVSGLPYGLNYITDRPLNTPYDALPPSTRDGCITICGVPLQSDTFTFYLNCIINLPIVGDDELDIPVSMIILADTTPSFSTTQYGCDSAWVNFTNLNPCNGNPGCAYSWDFGNGDTSIFENPDSVLYNAPGTYIINYQAVIDTIPRIINQITVLSSICNDDAPPFTTAPADLYLILKNSIGTELINNDWNIPVFGTDPNTYTPYSIYNGNFVIDSTETYTIEVWDDDNSLGNPDDQCGTFSINKINFASGDTITLVNAFSSIQIITSKIINTYHYTDSITVDSCTFNTVNLYNPVDGNNVVSVYPNPSNGFFTLNTDISEVTNIELINSLGKTISLLPINPLVDLTDFINGTYYLSVITSDSRHVIKLIKQ